MKNEKRSRGLIAAVIVIYLLAVAVSLLLAGRVAINYDISEYLNESTDTKRVLSIMKDEFALTGTLEVMVRGIDESSAEGVASEISDVGGVLNVAFDASDSAYYRDRTALFIVITEGDDYSGTASKTAADIRALLDGRYPDAAYGGAVIEKQQMRNSITGEMIVILAVSVALVVIILMLTADSWLEPVLLLGVSGVAVLINRGTNILFGEISYITNSIAAILQLALSIDYSIVLLNAYRSKKAEGTDRVAAMRGALKSVLKPVTASALTTVAGLLALLFMSFRLGYDIGIVLIKGIVISAVSSLTLFPAVILCSDFLLRRTSKRKLILRGGPCCRAAFRTSRVIAPAALVLIVLGAILSQNIVYIFSDPSSGNPEIRSTFGQSQTTAVVYPRGEDDDARERELIARVSGLLRADGEPVLSGSTAYATTVHELLDAGTLAEKFGIGRDQAALLLAMYHLSGNPGCLTLTKGEFLTAAASLLSENPEAGAALPEGTAGIVGKAAAVARLMAGEYTAAGLHAELTGDEIGATGIGLSSVEELYEAYFEEILHISWDADDTLVGRVFVWFTLLAADREGTVAERIPEEVRNALLDMQTIDKAAIAGEAYRFREMAGAIGETVSELRSVTGAFGFSDDLAMAVYLTHAVSQAKLTDAVRASDLLAFITREIGSNTLLASQIDEGNRQKLDAASDAVLRAETLLHGEKHSRMLLSVSLPKEGEETEAFHTALTSAVHEIFGEGAYVGGEIASIHDLRSAYDRDTLLIGVFTIVAIFLIVMFIFRSLSLPVILVVIIQGAIWIALSVSYLTGSPVFFMSYIVATCILMGATIDYGILMCTNYIVNRQTEDRRSALLKSVSTAMPTVFTSGMILTVCGFVIAATSGQNIIAMVGALIGRGALASVILIMFVLPSVLYLLDRYILSLSLGGKRKHIRRN